MEKYFPIWLNHVTHTFVGITVWLEEWFYFHQRDNQKSFIIFITFFGFYFVWFMYIKLALDQWIYPMFDIGLKKRVFLISLIGLFAWICFVFAKHMHQKLWLKSKKEKKR